VIPGGLTPYPNAPLHNVPMCNWQLPSCRAKSKQSMKARPEDTKLSRIPEKSRPKEDTRHSRRIPEPAKKSSLSNLPTVMLGIFISSILYLAVQHHVGILRPLESGSVLLRGEWKSQCGFFDLLPEKWLDRLPMDTLLPICNYSSSSMLELGSDGTLRYFTKGNDGQRKEAWNIESDAGDAGQCSEVGGGKCLENGVTFVKDEYNWYVVMGQTRNALRRDVARDFFVEK
jgi:hypothetical protein